VQFYGFPEVAVNAVTPALYSDPFSIDSPSCAEVESPVSQFLLSSFMVKCTEVSVTSLVNEWCSVSSLLVKKCDNGAGCKSQRSDPTCLFVVKAVCTLQPVAQRAVYGTSTVRCLLWQLVSCLTAGS
jgi:hypothetical protein